MREPVLFSILFLAGILTVMPLHAVRADEGAAPAKAEDAKKDTGGEDGDKKKNVGADVTGGKFEGDPVYVHLAPIILPVITDQGAEQLVTLLIDVEVKDFDVADQIHTDMPRVRDALMRALYGGLGEGNLRDGKLLNVTKVKAKAIGALREVVPADGVRDVLIQGVSQRML